MRKAIRLLQQGEIPPLFDPNKDDAFAWRAASHGWGMVDMRWTKSLALFAQSHGTGRILEVMAGRGYLAKALREHGAEVTATSLFMSSYDGSQPPVTDVIESDAVAAVHQWGADHDLLLVSWPVVSNAMERCLDYWDESKPIVFIGESPLTLQYPGCATDEFFARVRIDHSVDLGYDSGRRHDQAIVMYKTC